MSEASVQLIVPERHGDNRGWFAETYNRERFGSLGISTEFLQDNHSFSAREFTLRGLHFQTPPYAQAKLVRCIRGRIFDVAVDIRHGSPTYGKWVAAELSAGNGHQLYIPVGFAHGFLTLEPNCEVVYKCSQLYAPDHEGGIIWNDPSIGIDWPVPEDRQVELSMKDRELTAFSTFESSFTYNGPPLTPLG